MMAKSSGTRTGRPGPDSVDELRADADASRAQLGETMASLARTTDLTKRAGQVRRSVRANPGRWGGTAAGLIAGAGTAVGLAAWRQRVRRRPVSRVRRAWRTATNRFR